MGAGNIEAIRDWSGRYFYKKSDVAEFFTKLNTGLMAYKFRIVSSPNANITITESALTNPQTYHITTYEDGRYDGLFFFHDQCTLTFTTIAGDTVVTPSSYEEVIPIDASKMDLSVFTIVKEGNMQASVASNLIQTTYASGNSIGCNVYSGSKINFTNIEQIKYDLTLENCYGGGAQSQSNFDFGFGLYSSNNSIVRWYDLPYKNNYNDASSSYTNEILDVSEVTGEYYICIVAHGWTSEISNIYLL